MVKAMGSRFWMVSKVKLGTTMSGSWACIWKRSPMVSMPSMPNWLFISRTASVPRSMPYREPGILFSTGMRLTAMGDRMIISSEPMATMKFHRLKVAIFLA